MQICPVNLSRRSPSYEMRLAKYAKRGFEVRAVQYITVQQYNENSPVQQYI